MASIPALVDAAHYAYARLSDAQLAVEIELVHSPALLAACARQRLDARSVRVEAALAILSGGIAGRQRVVRHLRAVLERGKRLDPSMFQ